MKSSVRWTVLAALAAAALPAAAQARPAARLTPYAGFLSSGSIAEGPFGLELGNAGAPVVGAQLGLSLTPNVALVGSIGYSGSTLQAGVPFLGGIDLADSKVLLYDAGLQLRFPAVSRAGTGLVPYVEGGVGGIRHEITAGPLTTSSNNVAFTLGGGVDLQLAHALGLRLMVKDHVSRFDYGEAIGVNREGRQAHNWVVGVGLNLGG